MGYRQLTQAQRYQIFAHRDVGLSQRQIAQQLGIHSSTVSRELRRNSGARDMNPHKRSVTAIRDAAPPGSGQSNSLA
ncbi:helix-turn-helix domain-containing protein [Halomonas sp. KX33721]|uniref:helix-turn-helix domain-containing protein n=1 Tax=Halomonas sp. KX33721 TaxID=1819251 RepID=UPI000FE13E08